MVTSQRMSWALGTRRGSGGLHPMLLLVSPLLLWPRDRRSLARGEVVIAREEHAAVSPEEELGLTATLAQDGGAGRCRRAADLRRLIRARGSTKALPGRSGPPSAGAAGPHASALNRDGPSWGQVSAQEAWELPVFLQPPTPLHTGPPVADGDQAKARSQAEPPHRSRTCQT